MTTILEPEIIPKGRRVKLKTLKRGTVPYVDKKELATDLNRSRTTLSQWEELLIKYSPDFRKFYSPGSPWNDFQAYCLEIIHIWREGIKSRKLPKNAYQNYITENSQLFTLENYKNDIQQQRKTDATINDAKLIEAA
ncbi:hypothetical protein [Planktothrix agardhii]|uniref:hypothetical protein n=1 Tax=Planktothrix agardhii TaxID=1160 RepID=UPI001D0AE733|nr:hypothetical protein [Planktothrix agardhii]MCB8762167.1 hypothetical protein [Planktothrix agardhii 1813]MCB8789035.1 hypothetical protein [Planktothrix agardhii 1025]MCF3578134.1 hypothetical protein [Planktothrix agardhii 1812]MCF3583285.1 hypothetical protein [Planktothrix agardhii 1811]MCF3614165.1 hypothetical protein [Planktothrix agardhii 1027]